jgi:hypothetical protein
LKDEIDHYPANFEGAWEGQDYKREIPERFSATSDDRLMNSMISSYAIEVKDQDGKPTGHFFLDKEGAKAASLEVIKTHANVDAKKEDGPVEQRFEETWNHFDVNKDGLIEVERMSQFFRYLLGNALAFDLQ